MYAKRAHKRSFLLRAFPFFRLLGICKGANKRVFAPAPMPKDDGFRFDYGVFAGK